MALIATNSTAKLVFNDELQLSSDSDGGASSGYDSGDIDDSESDLEPARPSRYTEDSDTEWDSEDSGSGNDYDSDSDSDIEASEDYEVIRYKNTSSLCDSLRYIITLPELCDVTFYVGTKKIPVYGVRAILGTRSRILYSMILKAEKEQEITKTLGSKKFRKSKKNKGIHLAVNVENFDAEVFRKIIEFVHCGAVDMDTHSVIGLLLGAEQFDLRDLKATCWDYLERCVEVGVGITHLETLLRKCHATTLSSRIASFIKNRKGKSRQIIVTQNKKETAV